MIFDSILVKLFSLGGADPSIDVVHYVMYEWAQKVTNIAFNISVPLLIAELGDVQFGQDRGRIVFSYTVTVTTILASLSYLTLTSVFEYENFKRKALFRFGLTSAILLILFILCFEPGAVYLASILAIISKVCLSIASIAYDALLDAISVNRDPHTISSRGYMTGYLGMLAFIITAAPIIAIFYFVVKLNTKWTEGIIPLCLCGAWFLLFLIQVNRNLPQDLGKGLSFDRKAIDLDSSLRSPMIKPGIHNDNNNHNDHHDNTNHKIGESEQKDGYIEIHREDGEFHEGRLSMVIISPAIYKSPKSSISRSSKSERGTWSEQKFNDMMNMIAIIQFGFTQGTKLQYENVLEVIKYTDLLLFTISFIFLQGASTTAQSVAVIVVTEILNESVVTVIAATLIGVVTAIIGVAFFKYLIFRRWITPKYVIILNIIIIILVLVYVLYISTSTELLILSAITGFQIGPIGALSRSIVSSLIPTKRQSRLFSFYQFSQDSTSWIGNLVIATVASSYGSSDIIYLHTVVYTCLVEIGIGLPFLVLVNYKRGVQFRQTIDTME